MIKIDIDFETGLAKPSQAVIIKGAGGVPVRITFASDPGLNPAIELSLSPQSSVAQTVAYLGDFDSQSATVFTGLLDTTDERLATALAGKEVVTFDCEVVVTVGDALPRRFPNFPVSVQIPKITGPTSTEGGPVWISQASGDTRYLRASQALAEIDAAGAGSRSAARGNIGLASMLYRESLAGPVTFNTVGELGQYWFDPATARLWVYVGGQFRYSTLISA